MTVKLADDLMERLRRFSPRHQWHEDVCILCGSRCRIDVTRMRLYSSDGGGSWQTKTPTCSGRRFFDP